MTQKYFSKDTREFLFLLNRHRVRYLIVGGEAVIYHGLARSTGDIDFFYEPTKANAARLFRALREFWGGRIPGISKPESLLKPHVVFQFGFPPNRIDLMNSISGVTFAEAWKARVTETFASDAGNVPVEFIGIDALIKNKRSVGRPKDEDDLLYLTAAKSKPRS